MKSILKRLVLWAVLVGFPSATLAAGPVQPVTTEGDPDVSLTLEKQTGANDALSLQQVIARVLLNNPELEAFSLEVRAREARAVQAGLYKNPGILFDVQDVFGSGDFHGIQQSQTTLVLSQVIELGGKRTRRMKAALSNKDLAQWDYETARMNILTRVAQAYIDALTAQEQLKQANQLVRLSRNSYKAVQARVHAGKVSPIHEVKAQVALSATRIERQQAKNNVQGTYRQLAAFWGKVTPDFNRLEGSLYRITAVPSYEALVARLKKNPDMARWAAEMVQRQDQVALEEARSIPNLRVGAGGRWFEETQDNTFVMELSIPIPLFDRNQGAIAEARHRLAKAKAERRAIELRLTALLARGYSRLANAHSRVLSLKNKILPGARTAFEAVNEGYRFGKFGYLEVLDSQRTWFTARSQFLNALAEYHKTVAEIERLTGQPVSGTEPAQQAAPGKSKTEQVLPTERETER